MEVDVADKGLYICPIADGWNADISPNLLQLSLSTIPTGLL
jgi:hypothetical protein